MQPIQSYEARWNPRTNKGDVNVVVGGKRYPLTIEDAAEFAAILQVLGRSNVQCNPQNWDLVIPPRPVGS